MMNVKIKLKIPWKILEGYLAKSLKRAIMTITYPEPLIQKHVAAAKFMSAIMKSEAVIRKKISLIMTKGVTGIPIFVHAYTSVPIPNASCPRPFTSKTSDMK